MNETQLPQWSFTAWAEEGGVQVTVQPVHNGCRVMICTQAGDIYATLAPFRAIRLAETLRDALLPKKDAPEKAEGSE